MDIQRANLLFLKFLCAVGFAFFASWIATVQLLAFNAVSPFHYDSAFYLYRSLELYDVFSLQGRVAALIQVIKNDKDFFDLIFRILFAPHTLAVIYGHMMVVTFFLCLFNLLCLKYTYQRTQSWALSLWVLGGLFIFPWMYFPVQGIADYWKESIAIFILGCAVISWLLSQHLSHKLWSCLCSVFLGLLVMQRTGLAVYAAVLYLPMFLTAAVIRFRQEPFKLALSKIIPFVLPVSICCLFVLFFQWTLLFNYYVFKAYDYVTFFSVFKQLVSWVIHDKCFCYPIVIFITLFFLSGYFIADWKKQLPNMMDMLWMVIAFPLIIIASRALYSGFYNIWSILIVALFAVMIPVKFSSAKNRKKYNVLVFSLIIMSIPLEVYLCKIKTNETVKNLNGFRTFYDNVTNVIMAQPSPHHFSFLISEDYAKLYDHAALNRHIPLNTMQIHGFASVHDSYYQLAYKDKTNNVQSLAENIIKGLEQEGMLVFSYCNIEQVAKSIAFGNDAATIAIPIIARQAAYLMTNTAWHVIKKLESPYGCVYAYRYSKEFYTDKIDHQKKG